MGQENFTLTRPLYLVDTGNGARIAIDGNSLIRRTTNASSPFGTGMATDTTGVKGYLRFDFVLPAMTLSAGVFALLQWQLDEASAGSALGRLNLRLKMNGGDASPRAPAVAYGPPHALDTGGNPVYRDTYHLRASGISVPQGAIFGFCVEFEVVTASGSPGSTCSTSLLHDPADTLTAAIVEINV